MALLIIAYCVYTVISLPYAIKAAKHQAAMSSGYGVLVLAGLAFCAVALFLFMNSIGYPLLALFILLPAFVGVLTGIVIGIYEAL